MRNLLNIKSFASFICISYQELQTSTSETNLIFTKMENNKTTRNVTSTNAGDDGEAVSKSPPLTPFKKAQTPSKPIKTGWYVAVVRVNCEKRIATDIQEVLNSKGIWFEYWVPTIKDVVLDKRTKKRKKVERTFLSTFIFCHISTTKVNEVRFRSDVYKMLSMPGQREIYQIPDIEIENYQKFIERSCTPISSHTGPLFKGQKVKILGGPLQGVEAYVQRTKGTKAIIGCEIKYISGATVEIDRNLLEVIK